MSAPPLDVGQQRIPGRQPLRIGLISDTHIPEACPQLWPQVFDAFLTSTRVTFITFAVLCLMGALASLARGARSNL